MSRWTVQDIPDQTGRSVVITGANSGLGLHSAEALAAKGATVLLACRNLEKAAVALDQVKAVATGAPPEVVALDLSSLDSVRRAAAEIADRAGPIDVLMNNAGVMALPKTQTADGFEMQFGTNHLGHFALTGLLLPALLPAAQPRVVTVSSNGHRMGRLHLDDLNYEHRRYHKWLAYGQSKLANLLFGFELARRAAAAGTDLVSAVAHPGYAETNLSSQGPAMTGNPFMKRAVRISDKLFGQSGEMGALPQLYAATMPDVKAGEYIGPRGFAGWRGYPDRAKPSGRARDERDAAALWERSEELTGVTYPWPS